MRQIYILSFCMLMVTFYCKGQTTITSNSFLEVGDLLYTGVDGMPAITLGGSGTNQNWDFSSLTSPETIVTEVLDASSGSNASTFPTADLLLTTQGGELYLKTESNQIKSIGIAGDFGLGIPLAISYSPQGIYRKEISYQESYTYQEGLIVAADADDLPFLDSLGLPVTPDSVRLRTVTTTQVTADAWGQLLIPSGSFDVLRLRQEGFVENIVEAKISIFGWQDVTDLVGDFFPAADTTLTYVFLAEGEKEAIASVRVDEFGSPTSATYKTSAASNAIDIEDARYGIFAYPNPAIDKVKVDVKGFPTGKYLLKLFNITGQVVYEKPCDIQGDTTIRFSVLPLPKGTYLYTLQDSEGTNLMTKRLLIVKP